MNIDAYLKRINYDGPLEATAETLRQLQLAHLRSVPFENLSIHAHEPIVLNDEALFSKIVDSRRGGFCYEANGLFAALLRALDFDVTMLSAGVANKEGDYGPDFDHMALMVKLEDRWLADVGFGDSFLEPLLLDNNGEQAQGNQAFKITHDNYYRILWRRIREGEWTPQYRFTLQSYSYPDYEEMCLFHQTSPQSHFTQGRLCSKVTPNGRITMTGMRIITTSHEGLRYEQQLNSQEEYERALREHFGIVMKKTA